MLVGTCKYREQQRNWQVKWLKPAENLALMCSEGHVRLLQTLPIASTVKHINQLI